MCNAGIAKSGILVNAWRWVVKRGTRVDAARGFHEAIVVCIAIMRRVRPRRPAAKYATRIYVYFICSGFSACFSKNLWETVSDRLHALNQRRIGKSPLFKCFCTEPKSCFPSLLVSEAALSVPSARISFCTFFRLWVSIQKYTEIER